jgi:hypothetical protein
MLCRKLQWPQARRPVALADRQLLTMTTTVVNNNMAV